MKDGCSVQCNSVRICGKMTKKNIKTGHTAKKGRPVVVQRLPGIFNQQTELQGSNTGVSMWKWQSGSEQSITSIAQGPMVKNAEKNMLFCVFLLISVFKLINQLFQPHSNSHPTKRGRKTVLWPRVSSRKARSCAGLCPAPASPPLPVVGSLGSSPNPSVSLLLLRGTGAVSGR